MSKLTAGDIRPYVQELVEINTNLRDVNRQLDALASQEDCYFLRNRKNYLLIRKRQVISEIEQLISGVSYITKPAIKLINNTNSRDEIPIPNCKKPTLLQIKMTIKLRILGRFQLFSIVYQAQLGHSLVAH